MPYYTIHKVMAGLIDAHHYLGNTEALQIAERMADCYAAFFERASYNGILSLIAPDTGRVIYFHPLHGDFKTYLKGCECCEGTGIENTARYGEGIYYDSPNTLHVNLYVPSLKIPSRLTMTRAKDDPEMVSLAYGPLVLAARLGKEGMPGDVNDKDVAANLPRPVVPAILDTGSDPATWLHLSEKYHAHFPGKGLRPGKRAGVPTGLRYPSRAIRRLSALLVKGADRPTRNRTAAFHKMTGQGPRVRDSRQRPEARPPQTHRIKPGKLLRNPTRDSPGGASRATECGRPLSRHRTGPNPRRLRHPLAATHASGGCSRHAIALNDMPPSPFCNAQICVISKIECAISRCIRVQTLPQSSS